MAYLVLARKWRPQTFDDVVGQEHVTRTLQNAIRAERVAHAFLFCGMRGVGKTTAARLLAKALNCEKGPTPEPCNVCKHCQEITAGSAVDVLEIDGASNRGINEVRQIIENVRYQPATCRFKIYIIDEVHQVTHDAFNALLKTLEEPPPHVKFILATTEAHKVPQTILSRCQRYDFKRISGRDIAGRLHAICDADKISVSDQGLLLVAREAEGSMRDAQSLLDQVIAFAGKKIGDQDVVAALGVADRTVLYAVGAAVADRAPAKALERLEELHLFGYDLRRFARDLLAHFRNLAVAKLGGLDALLGDLSADELTEVRRQADRLSNADIDRCFRIMLAAEEEAGRSPYPKLILEMALIKLATLAPVEPIESVLDRLDALAAGGAVAARPAASSPSRATGTAPPREPTRASEATASVPRANAPAGGGGPWWDEFLALVGNEKPMLAQNLQQCAPAVPENGQLDLVVPAGFHHDYLADRDHLVLVENFAGRMSGAPVKVTVRAGAPTPKAAKPPPPDRAQIAKDVLGDPTVKAVVDILGGEVREVKNRAAE